MAKNGGERIRISKDDMRKAEKDHRDYQDSVAREAARNAARMRRK